MHLNTENKILLNFTNFISREIDLSAYKTIFVGFSGGADSTALLLILHELSKIYNYNLTAVHFEHGLRGKAGIEDAEWCENFCCNKNIQFLKYSLNVQNNLLTGENIEAGARRLRNGIWEKLSSSQDCAVALGHHAGDKIENLFIRLIRGSNSSGLTSLRIINHINCICFLRPLLSFSKQEIKELLLSQKIKNWREDLSNNEDIYQRNFLRNSIIPKLKDKIPNSNQGFINAYNALEQDALYIEKESISKYKAIEDKSAITFDFFNNLAPALQVRVLRYWIKNRLGYEIIPNSRLMERLKNELSKNTSYLKLLPVNKDIFLKLKNKNISIYKEVERVSTESKIWKWKKEKEIFWNNYKLKAVISSNIKILTGSTIYFDVDSLPEKLIIRSWIEGDRITPFKSNTQVRVKKILKNEKVDPEERKQIPILCTEKNQIVWIAGVKRSNLATYCKETTKLVFFTVSKIN
ncbi:MAG TPA: tRNA lysidine(34) synthetase TilS [Victivallales bacterium]|nr:tRNA lysidine(34) synthetase TilS [Victivallales bacterium]